MKIVQLLNYRPSTSNITSTTNTNTAKATACSGRTHNNSVHYLPNNSICSKMLVFITILIVNACIAGTIPATPENITVTFLTPTTVRVSWQTVIDLNAHPVEKYIVTYKPTDDRVVQDVAGNSEAIILDRLSPSTQYSIAVTAIWLGKKYRSRPIVFRTLDIPKPSSQQDLSGNDGLGIGGGGAAIGAGVFGSNAGGGVGFAGGNLSGRGATNASVFGDDVTSTATNTLSRTHRELPTIRGVEIGIVLIVLCVWAGAIALFFNRWGKIRMLLPYQPDYKHEQLKVPGTGVCSGGVCNGQHSHQFDSSECGALAYQPLHYSSRHFHMLQEERSTSISERCTRSRINSAIFVSSEGRGFDSIEFLRRHGSQSVLCRKARSAENITDNNRKKSFSGKRQWRTDESAESTEGKNSTAIELQESRPPSETRTLSVLKSNAEHAATAIANSVIGHLATAAVTTSNMVVGSISIEAPPSHIKDELQTNTVQPASESKAQASHVHPTITSTSSNSASRDSTDTVEELIPVPTETKSRVLVHQRSSNASLTNRSQSPALSTPHSSPKALKLKVAKPPNISALPMVSVSGPSPTTEEPPLSECL